MLISRLLEVKDKLKIILDEQGWDDLAASEWRTLKNLSVLLHPITKFTSLLSGDKFTTLSCMNIHLEEVSNLYYVCYCLYCYAYTYTDYLRR